MYLKLFIISLIFLSQTSLAQFNSNFKVQELSITDTSTRQYSILFNQLEDKQIIAIGEASHGTQEFYSVKSTIIKNLVQHEKFTTLALEMDENMAEKLNQYTSGNLEEISSILKNYGLYNSQELNSLITWIKQYNSTQSDSLNKISIIGFDNHDYWNYPYNRDSLMFENFDSKRNEAKTIIWAHNSHIIKGSTWDTTNSGVKSMGQYLDKRYKDDYYVLVLDTYSGRLNTIENGLIESFDFTIDKELLPVNFANYILVSNGNQHPLKYNLTNLSSNAKGNPRLFPIIIDLDIDALIFIKETTPSIVLK